MAHDCFTPEQLDDYLHDAVDEIEAARIDEHLASCDACSRICRQLRTIADAWETWTSDDVIRQDLVAASPSGRGARAIYVAGGEVIRARIFDARVEAGRLHFSLAIDLETDLPRHPALDVVFLETLEIATVPLADVDRRDLADGISCSVDIPRELRRGSRAGADAVAWRIRGADAST